MDKQTYTQRVQALAQEFAREMHPQAWSDRALSVEDSNYWHIKVDNYKPLARIAVAEMAEAYRLGRVHACERGKSYEKIGTIEKAQKEQGLIPDNEQEGESDGK